MKTIAFTGHRPDKLYGYDLNDEGYTKLRLILNSVLKNEICHNDADAFITGGALGFDTLVFDVVRGLIEDYGGNHILAIPFEKQAVKWSIESQKVYREIKKFSTCIYVDDYEKYNVKNVKGGEYHPAKMQKKEMNGWLIIVTYL